MSTTGLHARKRPTNHEDLDLEIPNSSASERADKTHRRSFLSRLVRSEVGCAIEAVIGFLLFGLFLGYIILHHQQRKVRVYASIIDKL